MMSGPLMSDTKPMSVTWGIDQPATIGGVCLYWKPGSYPKLYWPSATMPVTKPWAATLAAKAKAPARAVFLLMWDIVECSLGTRNGRGLTRREVAATAKNPEKSDGSELQSMQPLK